MALSSAIPVCLLTHANLQYAEIPASEIGNIVEKSYIPTLDLFLKVPKAKIVMDFSGVTLEILSQDYPVVIEKLRRLIKKGSVEFCGSTYANPLLPLIPLDHARRQVRMYKDIWEKLFGDLDFQQIGFFQQEYFIDAALVALLEESGYKWVPVHGIQLINSLSRNLNFALREPVSNIDIAKNSFQYRDISYPFKIIGALGSSLFGFGSFDKFTIERLHQVYEKKISFPEYTRDICDLVDPLKKEHPFIFLGPSDLEFVGHFSFEGHQPIDPQWLGDFCVKLDRDRRFIFQTPREFILKQKITKPLYLRCGGDHMMMDPWMTDPDNVRLNNLCNDASRLIEQTQLQIATFRSLGHDTKRSESVLEEAWKFLMLAENADGRGWHPIPERRLFCYNNALRAREEALKALEFLSNMK